MDDQPITLANWDTPPFNRTSFLNVSDFIPVVDVSRGDQKRIPLNKNLRDIGSVAVTLIDGKSSTVDQVLHSTETDGFLVLHHGEIISEQYFNGMAENTLHLAQSVSKSVTGTLVGIYLERGLLKRNALVKTYVPELAASAYGDATLDQVINMQTGVKFSEDYLDPEAEFALLDSAAGWKDFQSESDPKSIHDLLVSIESDRPHGEYFQYRSIDTDVLAWVCERVGGDSLAKLISKEIWSKIGAEYDASFTVDRAGTALADGGLNATLRDFGRFAQMYLSQGSVNGQQVASRDWIEGCKGNNNEAFRVLYPDFATRYPNASYINQWWVVDGDRGIYSARGVFGQFIYIDQSTDVIVVKLSTWPTFLDTERGLNTYRMAEAIAEHLTYITGAEML